MEMEVCTAVQFGKSRVAHDYCYFFSNDIYDAEKGTGHSTGQLQNNFRKIVS